MIAAFLKPFHEETTVTSKKKAAVSSKVIPDITEVKLHVNNKCFSPFLKPLCDSLRTGMESRFSLQHPMTLSIRVRTLQLRFLIPGIDLF